MPRRVHLTILVGLDGNAEIRIPHNKNQQRDANAAAAFTDKLSQALGDVVERHIGDHHHHDSAHTHSHDHLTH